MSAAPGYLAHANASLLERTTFRVPARAATLIEVHDAACLPERFDAAARQNRDVLILGDGSNVLFTRDWPGIVLSLRTRGIDIVAEHFDSEDDAALVRAAAGEIWDDFVRWTLARGLTGLENLAGIPGSVGAAPIQNIGAYGVEVGEFVHAVQVWDRRANAFARIDGAACAFGYRDSLFKHEAGRYLVVAVDFRLPRRRALRLDYAGIREELAALGATKPDARAVAHAIARLRARKLIDPRVAGNAGSFFKNPLVPTALGEALEREHAAMPQWPVSPAASKLSAAWLIEACGFKGFREGDAGVSPQHALVLLNHGHATGAQIHALAQRIIEAVDARFRVRLEPEPLIV